MKHQSLDWNKHCRYEFGTYVQANQDNLPTNTNAPRTIDAIYLRPCWDCQGGHELMNLETGELVTRQYVTPILITNTVIKVVEAMAEAQGVKSLKITGRNKVCILLADWIAGVHYDDADSKNSDNNHQDEIPEPDPEPHDEENENNDNRQIPDVVTPDEDNENKRPVRLRRVPIRLTYNQSEG